MMKKDTRSSALRARRLVGVIGGITASALFVVPSEALAHHAEWMKGRHFIQGLSMPLHGIDHMLVAAAVGLMAAQLGGWALWAIPSAFALFMLIAGILNVNGIAVPGLEQTILGSILVLGVILARRRPLPSVLGVIVVALLAAIQGSALIESPASAAPDWSLLRFSAGCIASALVVLGSGIGLGLALERIERREVLRYAGVTIIAAGILVYVFPSANDVVIRLLESAP
jgi:urease accessory protein